MFDDRGWFVRSISNFSSSDVLRADGLVPLMLGLMRTEKHEKVLEKIATSDRATIVIERACCSGLSLPRNVVHSIRPERAAAIGVSYASVHPSE